MRWGEDDSPFALLRSLEQAGPEFLVVPPAIFFPEYAFELDDVTAERLGIIEADDALILVIVTVDERVEQATANLLGPLVVNRHTRQAAQVVLAGSGYETRTPLLAS